MLDVGLDLLLALLLDSELLFGDSCLLSHLLSLQCDAVGHAALLNELPQLFLLLLEAVGLAEKTGVQCADLGLALADAG